MVCEFMITPRRPSLRTRALDFLRGGLRILWCGGRQSDETRRVFADGLGQLVVAGGGEGIGGGRVEHLHAGRGQRQHLHVDAAGIHVGDAVRRQVLQAIDDETRAFAGALEIEAPQAAESRVVVAVGQQLAEQGDLVARRERFLGGDALVVPSWILANHGTGPCSRQFREASIIASRRIE